MANVKNGQTCLELYSIEERNNEVGRSDYSANDPYGATHKDALSDGDIQGKGTGHGGHSYWLPSCSNLANSTKFDYSNFDTFNGGNCIDVAMREKNLVRSLYNADNDYNTSIDTSANRADGQYVVEYKRSTIDCTKWLSQIGIV